VVWRFQKGDSVANVPILAVILTVSAILSQTGRVSIPDTWTKRTQPFRVIDNVYYVGTEDLSSFLITSTAGHVLIDTGYVSNADAVIASIHQLGFKVQDVRIILTTQAHFDHVGAHARLAEVSGARVLVSAQDAPLVREGGKGDFHFGPDYYFPKVKVDGELHDGEVVTLGDISLTARITPGHTKGTTTWTMMAKDRNGRMRHVVVLGSTTVNDGVKLVDNREYPQIASDFRKSFRVQKGLTCEIFLAAHASAFNGLEKAKAAAGGKSEDAFVDPQGCRAAIERTEKAFEALLAEQGGQR
jgi:metallo-beta-lactamase class B